MGKTVAIGVQDFGQLREYDNFYVDKTYFIKDWWENRDAVTLITRPRRFGKTLTMSMLDHFFSVKHKKDAWMFEGLSIWENAKYHELQGTYPVISLSFAGVKQDKFEDAYGKICSLLLEIYLQYEEELMNSQISESDKINFKSTQNVLLRQKEETSLVCLNVVEDAIHTLSMQLYKYYGKKVLIFLDEYDTPMQEAYLNGYWKEMVSFIRNMFNNAFKTNPYMERAILTGITRISKESIFSDLNNLVVITSSTNIYEDVFGFTENEVFHAMDKIGLADKESVKLWYDGFVFGKLKDIYNPWSITQYLRTGKTDLYWANTSSNGLISKLLRESEYDFKMDFEKLLEGECVETELDEQVIFDQLDDDPDAVWSLFLASGYLKIDSIIRDDPGDDPVYRLSLTNLEVKKMVQKLIKGWFKKGRVLSKFVAALLQGDIRGMNLYMNDIVLNTMSYFDSGKRPSTKEPENFYHGLVLGLIVEKASDYIVRSNRESGYGRYDIVMEPFDKKENAVIMEFKVFDEEDNEKTLDDTLANALAQIEEKKYETDLLAAGVTRDRIYKYGFAFEGKKVKIAKV